MSLWYRIGMQNPLKVRPMPAPATLHMQPQWECNIHCQYASCQLLLLCICNRNENATSIASMPHASSCYSAYATAMRMQHPLPVRPMPAPATLHMQPQWGCKIHRQYASCQLLLLCICNRNEDTKSTDRMPHASSFYSAYATAMRIQNPPTACLMPAPSTLHMQPQWGLCILGVCCIAPGALSSLRLRIAVCLLWQVSIVSV
jgi:hypothetical protein